MTGSEKGREKYLGLSVEDLGPLANIPLISVLKTSKRKRLVKSLSLAEFVDLVGLVKAPLIGSDILFASTEDTREFSGEKNGIKNLQSILETTRGRGLLRDFVGITQKIAEDSLVFSAVVGKRPKPYLSMYFLFARRLKKEIPSLKFYVHLEDWFPHSYPGETIPEEGVKAYREYIERFQVVDKIFTTSLISKKVISQKFIEDYLSQITFNDFISVLPFHKQSIEKVCVSDLIHFIWNLYLISQLRGIYLTSINSKREFLIFRKALRGYPPVIFFPVAPESILSSTDTGFYEQYITFSGIPKAEAILEP